MYEKGQVKSLTFEWDQDKKNWGSREEAVASHYGHFATLGEFLEDHRFVSAAACGGKQGEKLVLFYI